MRFYCFPTPIIIWWPSVKSRVENYSNLLLPVQPCCAGKLPSCPEDEYFEICGQNFLLSIIFLQFVFSSKIIKLQYQSLTLFILIRDKLWYALAKLSFCSQHCSLYSFAVKNDAKNIYLIVETLLLRACSRNRPLSFIRAFIHFCGHVGPVSSRRGHLFHRWLYEIDLIVRWKTPI